MCMQISVDAMRLFLSFNAMQLRALRRRQGITSIEVFVRVDGIPDTIFCGIVITGESDDSVRRVAEDIEDSGWSHYQANGRQIFEQVTNLQVKNDHLLISFNFLDSHRHYS